MWMKRLIKQGAADGITIPVVVMNEFGWKRGDYVQLEVAGPNLVTLRKVPERALTDDELLSTHA